MTTATKSVAVAPQEAFRFLVYAKWGTGKTRLVATAAAVQELSPVLFLSLDKTTAVIDRKKFPVTIVNINTAAELTAALATVGNYKTIIIDTLTDLHRLMLREAMKENKIVADQKQRRKSDFVPEPLDYNGAQNGVIIVLAAIRDRNINLICTAQDGDIVDGVGAEQITLYDHAPRTAKTCSQIVPEFFQAIAYAERKGETVTLDFNKQRSIVKDTRKVFKALLTNPTIATIYAAYNNGKGGE